MEDDQINQNKKSLPSSKISKSGRRPKNYNSQGNLASWKSTLVFPIMFMLLGYQLNPYLAQTGLVMGLFIYKKITQRKVLSKKDHGRAEQFLCELDTVSGSFSSYEMEDGSLMGMKLLWTLVLFINLHTNLDVKDYDPKLIVFSWLSFTFACFGVWVDRTEELKVPWVYLHRKVFNMGTHELFMNIHGAYELSQVLFSRVSVHFKLLTTFLSFLLFVLNVNKFRKVNLLYINCEVLNIMIIYEWYMYGIHAPLCFYLDHNLHNIN